MSNHLVFNISISKLKNRDFFIFKHTKWIGVNNTFFRTNDRPDLDIIFVSSNLKNTSIFLPLNMYDLDIKIINFLSFIERCETDIQFFEILMYPNFSIPDISKYFLLEKNFKLFKDLTRKSLYKYLSLSKLSDIYDLKSIIHDVIIKRILRVEQFIKMVDYRFFEYVNYGFDRKFLYKFFQTLLQYEYTIRFGNRLSLNDLVKINKRSFEIVLDMINKNNKYSSFLQSKNKNLEKLRTILKEIPEVLKSCTKRRSRIISDNLNWFLEKIYERKVSIND